MSQTLTIRGRYENQTFIPAEPMPAVEGEAELIVTPKSGEKKKPTFVYPPPQHTPEEFARLVNELSKGPPTRTLPADWSRADIYDDHD
jgi:hypothetical protein